MSPRPPEGAAAREVLRWAMESFGSSLALATSLGAEDMVLLHEVAHLHREHGFALPHVFFLDTGRLHEETYALLAGAQAHYGVPIEVYFPSAPLVESLVRRQGPLGFRASIEARKECCNVRKVEQLLLDYGRLGLSLDDHPMHHVRPHLTDREVATTKSLADLRDQKLVRLAGLVIGRQRPMTASGVTFITLEDETGIANLVVTVPVFERFRHVVLYAKLVLVTGRVEKEGEVIHVLVHELERLELREGVALSAKSRDFH